MNKRLTSGVVAAVVALSMSVPAVGLANKGGTPRHTPAKCSTKKHYGKHKGTRGQRKGSTKGNKCGMPKS